MSFPKNFHWGVATAAHQIEGGNVNSDWWDFEHQKGNIAAGDKSGNACDHWNKLEEDTQLMVDLGVNSYRFSIEWAKIEPKKGTFSTEAMEHYVTEVDLLIKSGIEAMVTLHHFVNPKWFSDIGGWANKEAPEMFLRYASFVYKHLGSKVNFWLTINEPMMFITWGYVDGSIPPQRKDFAIAEPIENLLLSHSKVYHHFHREAKKENRKIMIGFANNMGIFAPARIWNPLDHFAAFFTNKNFTWTFHSAFQTGILSLRFPPFIWKKKYIENITETQDFIGVNYYTKTRLKVHPLRFKKPKKPISLVYNKSDATCDLGWEFYPEGLLYVLRKVKSMYPKLPIFITENGIADATDRLRSHHLKVHLSFLKKAIDEGIDVRGYYHWSLMDNFEWFEGYMPRFGLYHVDYSTQKRTLRKSGEFYRNVIAQNSI